MSGLGEITSNEMLIIGTVIGGFFYGIYSGIFCMYIWHQASKELGIDKRDIVLYALCILYILSAVSVAVDVILSLVLNEISTTLSPSQSIIFRYQVVSYASITVIALCDFISQGILIYRCWIIWNCNIRVIIIPSILSLAFLAIWLTTNHLIHIPRSPPIQVKYTALGNILALTSLVISLIVNAVVTGLIVFRIFKVYREVGRICENRTLGRAETKFRSIMFIIIESGMVMSTIQLISLVFVGLPTTAVSSTLTVGIYQMFLGLTPTIILLRVSMGLSYHDEQSMVQAATSLRFALYNQNPISETEGTIEIAPGQERVDYIGIQQSASNDIEIMDR